MSSQEQPEDQQPDDDEKAEAEKPDDDAPPTEDERLEQITERIDKARTKAEDAGVLEDEDQEYVESGVTEEEDDQTITPPG